MFYLLNQSNVFYFEMKTLVNGQIVRYLKIFEVLERIILFHSK